MNMASCFESRKSVKALMGPMLESEMLWSADHVRFGPNTTARLDEVILFRQLRSITWGRSIFLVQPVDEDA